MRRPTHLLVPWFCPAEAQVFLGPEQRLLLALTHLAELSPGEAQLLERLIVIKNSNHAADGLSSSLVVPWSSGQHRGLDSQQYMARGSKEAV